MKLMDEVAGIVAARHCKTNIVTASVDAINFHDKIRKGNRTLPMELRGEHPWGLLESPVPVCLVFTPDVCPRATRDRRAVLRASPWGCICEASVDDVLFQPGEI